jgi:putative zinc finger protein
VNEHPDILLAEYVDGTLAPDARAEVDAHLARCDRCRGEVSLAHGSRVAVAGLPAVPAPPGVTFAVRRRATGTPSPRTGRWVAAAAAAAVLAAAGVVVVRGFLTPEDEAPGGGGGLARAPAEAPGARQEAGGEAAAEGALAADATAVPTYTESRRRYDQTDLVDVGRRLRDRARATIQAGLAPTATRFYEGFDLGAFTPQVQRAIECSLREVPPEQLLVPYAIEAATYQGEPAYVAAFLQGPTPDLPYDRVVIWVVARPSCSLRSLATQRL